MMHCTVHEWGRVPVGEGGFSRAQADSLLVAARGHALGGVEGTAILCDHHRHLSARQAVGVIAGGGCSLEILPKMDRDTASSAPATVRTRLIHMLDVALGLDLSIGEATTMANRAETLLDLFIALFADRLLTEVRRGLPRQYQMHEDDLQILRGRLNVARQFTANAVRPDQLACRFDVLHTDTPLMRVMKACVVFLARHARNLETQRKLAELRFLFAEVSDVAPKALPWPAVRIDRTSRRWQALLGLARMLLGARWQQTHADPRQPDGITLLFPMNELFERYVAVQLRRALAPRGLQVVSQGGLEYCLGEWRPEERCRASVFRTKPDLIVRGREGILAVADTKWKRLSDDPLDRKNGIAQGDVYQLMAYARLYRCERLMLLYPATGDLGPGIIRSFGLAHGLERLDVGVVDLTVGGDVVVRQLATMFA